MTAVRQVKTHQTFMGLHNCLVHLQVGRGARQALDINTPLCRVKVEGLKSTLLAESLDRVDVFVATVVTSTRVSLGVLVGHGGAQSIIDSARSDILRGDQEDGFALAFDLEVLWSLGRRAIHEG